MAPVTYSTCTWLRSFVIDLIWSVANLKLIVKETITREAKKKKRICSARILYSTLGTESLLHIFVTSWLIFPCLQS